MRRPKTALALWIKTQREAREWKSEELARRLRDAGYRAEDATVRAWEANRKPGDDAIRGLEQIFGAVAPSDGEQRGDQLALAAAIDRQTAALRELAAAIREGFLALDNRDQARSEHILDRVEAIAAAVSAPAPEGAADMNATIRSEDDALDRPPEKRRRGTRRPRLDEPRPGWGDAPPRRMEMSRSDLGVL